MKEVRTEDFIDRQVIRGGILLRTFTILNVIFILVNMVLSLANGINNLIGSLLMLFICFFIYYGSSKAKWFFIIVTCFNVFGLFFALAEVGVANVPLILWLVYGLSIISNVSTSAILIFSASVNEFIYKQAN